MGTYTITIRSAHRPLRIASRPHPRQHVAAAAPTQPVRRRPSLAPLSFRARLAAALLTLVANALLIGGVLALFASRG